jgi:hypothetical protein
MYDHIIWTNASAQTKDGRSIVALKGDVRQRLDHLLVNDENLRGIGRSAFIAAAIEIYEAENSNGKAVWSWMGRRHENILPS